MCLDSFPNPSNAASQGPSSNPKDLASEEKSIPRSDLELEELKSGSFKVSIYSFLYSFDFTLFRQLKKQTRKNKTMITVCKETSKATTEKGRFAESKRKFLT